MSLFFTLELSSSSSSSSSSSFSSSFSLFFSSSSSFFELSVKDISPFLFIKLLFLLFGSFKKLEALSSLEMLLLFSSSLNEFSPCKFKKLSFLSFLFLLLSFISSFSIIIFLFSCLFVFLSLLFVFLSLFILLLLLLLIFLSSFSISAETPIELIFSFFILLFFKLLLLFFCVEPKGGIFVLGTTLVSPTFESLEPLKKLFPFFFIISSFFSK